MKKTLALLLALLLVFSLAACTSGSNEPAADPGSAPVIKEAEDGGVFDGRIGETIRTYFYDFKVTDAYLCDDYHGFTAQDGNVLLVVKLDIENTMNSSIPMSDLDFQAQWGDDADDAFAWPITSDPETMDDRGTLCDEQLPYEYEMSVLCRWVRAHRPVEFVPIETIYEDGNASSHFHPLRDTFRIHGVLFANVFSRI